eukprot:1687711-Prymnesium_polylepis.1
MALYTGDEAAEHVEQLTHGHDRAERPLDVVEGVPRREKRGVVGEALQPVEEDEPQHRLHDAEREASAAREPRPLQCFAPAVLVVVDLFGRDAEVAVIAGMAERED